MDWIQCNICRAKPAQAKLSLTQCAHVLCQNCVAKAKSTTQNCQMCDKKLNACEIGKSLPPEFMDLFKDVRQIASEAIAELTAAVKFQQSLRDFYVKAKSVQAGRDAETFNSSRKNREAKIEEMEKQKMSIRQDDERLKSLKAQKKQLTERLHSLKRHLPNPPPSSLRVKTEPPPSKSSRFLPPSLPRKRSLDPPNQQDQSVSKIATSTPLSKKSSLREYMNRFFTAGAEHPSPIPRDGL